MQIVIVMQGTVSEITLIAHELDQDIPDAVTAATDRSGCTTTSPLQTWGR
ncbi:MAG: hypothetical protein LIO80_06580 [Lachnospiraceae bacterium]|nr:hypothetical protein [Lachnospiraceae bacterium]